jgi:Uma2 family endonuclease
MAFQERVVTRHEFEQMLQRYPDRRLERINGELSEKMPSALHAFIVNMLAHFITSYLLQHPIGYSLVEARYGLPDDDANDRIPDLSFITPEKFDPASTGPLPSMPDLAVEVQSPGQSDRFMTDKAAYYLAHGSRMVWLIYPSRQLVEVLTPDERHLLTADAQIDGGAVLPGLQIPIQRIFPPETQG